MAPALAPPRLPRRINLGTPKDDEEDQASQISNAQATDLNQDNTGLTLSSGYTAPLTPPGGIMGGEQTQPDDFSQKVRTATAVESKGGPPLTELSAKTGKGPIQRPNAPSEEQKAKPPEAKPEPTPPTVLRAIAPGSAAPVKEAQPVTGERPGMTVQPGTTPPSVGVGTREAPPLGATPPSAATPTPTPTPAQPAAPAQPEGQTGTVPTPASLQNEEFLKRAKSLDPNKDIFASKQDYSKVSEEDRSDPNFAGISSNGRTVFMDSRGLYIRDQVGPGEEIRKYENAQPGSEEYHNGLRIQDANEKQLYTEASAKLLPILEAQTALKKYQEAVQTYKNQHGGAGPNWLQRQELAAQMAPEPGNPAETVGQTAAQIGGAIPGWTEVTPDMRNLDMARKEVSNILVKGILQGQPAREAMKLGFPAMPNTSDPLEIQEQKVKGLLDYINTQKTAIYSQRPSLTKWLKDAEAKAEAARVATRNAANPNLANPSPSPSPRPTASPTPGATPSATPAAGFTDEERKSAKSVDTEDAYNNLPDKAPYRWKGGPLRRKGVQ